MANHRGSVTVNNMNLSQGDFPEIERKFLFIGVAAAGIDTDVVTSLSSETDLDTVCGEADSVLKTQLTAAKLNAGENWLAWMLPVDASSDNAECILSMRESMDHYFTATSPEAVVCCRAAQSDDEIQEWHDAAMLELAEKGRQMFALVATPGVLATQTWSEYESTQAALVASLACPRAGAVPQLHGNNIGVLAGRLASRAVSIADSPMRVETGALLGLGAVPVDSEGIALPESVLATLAAGRLSVPQHYCDYPGTYWADGTMLDVPGGDYQVIEYLRPVLKACRAVRLLAIARIADRKFNDTPKSLAYHKKYFARPLRAMSKSTTVEIGGTQLEMVGDIMKPDKTAISVAWQTKSAVKLFIKVRPYSSPKDIEANIYLDLSLEGES